MKKRISIIACFAMIIAMLFTSQKIEVKAEQPGDGTLTLSGLTAPTTVEQGSAGNVVSFGFNIVDANGVVEGDTYTISTNIGTIFSGTTFTPVMDALTLENGSGHPIGTMKVTGTQLIITLSGPNVVGTTNVVGTFTTGPTLTADGALTGNQTLTVGTQSATIAFTTPTPTPTPTGTPVPTYYPAYNPAYIFKNAWASRSDTASTTQAYVNTDNLQKMIQGIGPIQVLHDVYFEDVIPHDGKYFPNSLKVYAALEQLQPCQIATLPYNNAWRGCEMYGVGTNTTGFSGIYGSFPDLVAMSVVTRVNPNAGESYSDFKTRLTQGEWGIWTDPVSNGDTLVINFGNLPDSGWLKYSDIGLSTDPDYQNIYGDANAYGGGVVGYEIWFDAYYPTVRGEETMTNTASLPSTEVANGNPSTSGNYTIKMGGGAGYAGAGEINLVLYDEQSKLDNPTDSTQWVPIANADFKIQITTDGGTTWTDYQVGGNTITGTTDATGFANLGVMIPGDFRVVQTSTDSTHSYAGTDATITSDTVTSFGTVTDQGSGIGTFTIAGADAYGYSMVVTNKAGTMPTPTPVVTPTPGTPTPGTNPSTPTPGRTCQDDGYPAGYYWNEAAKKCVIGSTKTSSGYSVPNTADK